MRSLLGVKRPLLPTRQPNAELFDHDELQRERAAFDRVRMALQQQRFPYALSASPVEVQPVPGCFNQTRRFIVGLMNTSPDARSAQLCVDIKPPPRTVHALRGLLAYGPMLLFGEGLKRRESSYCGPHAVAVLALLPDGETWEGPQLLIYDGDDTGADARGRALRDISRNARLELHEVSPHVA